jgi:hypothetical protein
MLALDLFAWWYGRGWANVGKQIRQMARGISQSFSIPLLLRTMFAPWRQIVTYPGASLDAKYHAFIDNTVSRAIGFVVRLVVLFSALIMVSLTVVVGALLAVLWPLLPLAAATLIIKGLVG